MFWPHVCFVATGNPGKFEEIKELLKIYFPNFTQIFAREPKDVDENSDTFQGNAHIKAQALFTELVFEKTPYPFAILADDSGLCVDALEGRPGVRSARYSEPNPSPNKNIHKLLDELKNIHDLSQRKAHYTCALCLILAQAPKKTFLFSSEGYCHGFIGFERLGVSGFGYDPVFLDPDTQKSFGQLDYNIKNAKSHRKQAFEKLKKITQAI